MTLSIIFFILCIVLYSHSPFVCAFLVLLLPGEGGGGYAKIWGGGVCCWDSETLTLNQTKFSCRLQTYTRVKTKTPFSIPLTFFQKLGHYRSQAKTKSSCSTTTRLTRFRSVNSRQTLSRLNSSRN